jgi:plasmid maintenance system antidote protein VapI
MTEGPYPNHLAEVMRTKGLTDPALARKLDISKQQIFNLRWGHRKLTVEWAKRLAPHLGVSWERLITGATTPADQERADLLAAYEAMDDEQRRALLVVVKGMLPRPKPDDPNPASSPPTPKERAPPKPPFQEGGNVKENRVSPLLTLVQSRDEAQPQPCSETAEQGD